MSADLIPYFIAITGVILTWLVILSFIIYRTVSHYNKLSRGITKQNLSTLLEKILSELELSRKEVGEVLNRCDKIERDGTSHIQKIGLLRFNPFSDTGGDQSFIIAILNGENDGAILSSLHGRANTRWYAKQVREGKGIGHELTHEEMLAIKNAKAII